MKNLLSIIFLLLVSQFVVAETYSFTAEVLLIEKDYIVVAGNRQKFMLVNKHSPAHTRIGSSFTTTYLNGSSKISFEMLAGVGYITKAKIIIADKLVKEIIVLEMHQ